jgi:hypothetical protein
MKPDRQTGVADETPEPPPVSAETAGSTEGAGQHDGEEPLLAPQAVLQCWPISMSLRI